MKYFIGVDAGTSSIRAALVNEDGGVLCTASEDLKIWEPQAEYYEQSSNQIWEACCTVVKNICNDINKELIAGIGFDATCSLVALDSGGHPVTVSPTKNPEQNVIMWLDHRAVEQAERIDDTNHEILKYVGGTISPEMQAPKLLWLKENLYEDSWSRAALFLDLPEFLTYKATGSTDRSLCSVVCKFNFMGHPSQRNQECSSDGWDKTFWSEISQDLVNDGFKKLGTIVKDPGSLLGHGLSQQAAQDLGLPEGIPVGASLIDAHAGGIGVLGANVQGTGLPCENQPITSRLALICGTSSCHMVVNKEPVFVPGVWGPYFSAMVPGLWLNEGGQSATGKLIDHIVQTHNAYNLLKEVTKRSGQSLYEELNILVDSLTLKKGLINPAWLTQNLHILPDFHGNRSPLADPGLRGMVCGLSLSAGLDDLVLLYLAALQGLAHGTRHIIETMNNSGCQINTIFACGGLVNNPLFLQVHADITGLPIVLCKEPQSVLVGAAILGACAARVYPTIQDAMCKMSKVGEIIWPNKDVERYYNKKHKVYLQMLDDQRHYKEIMEDVT